MFKLSDPEFAALFPDVQHGFFGRDGGVSTGVYESLNLSIYTYDRPQYVAENKRIVARDMNLSEWHFWTLNQTHSTDCLYVNHLYEGVSPEGDALVSDRVGMMLGVLTADCGPVLFCGKKEGGAPVIGAAHAGWRGALDGILENTIKTMCYRGAVPETIAAVIGPCIGPESYEVDQEFVQEFLKKDANYIAFFKEGKDKDHSMFDLPRFISTRLRKAGIKQVFSQWRDTYADEENFFSFRRESQHGDGTCGRQASVIAIV